VKRGDDLIRSRPVTDLELVYREHGQRLWRALYAYSGNRQLAEDSVAEAFAQALRRGEGVRDPAAWVWRAAFRIAAGELKERRSSEPMSEGTYELAEPLSDLVRALAKLSRHQRSALILHHYAGYPVKQVAQLLDSTAQAVRVHLFRGRKRLRALLDASDEGDERD
jgi:RNA polymerase sigma-70 factor (ECF subfamily)